MRAAPARLGSSTPAPVAWQAGVVRCHSHEEQARSCLHNVSLDYIPDLSAYHSAPSPSSPACERPRHNVGAAHHAAPCPTSHRAQQRSSISGAIQCMALCRTYCRCALAVFAGSSWALGHTRLCLLWCGVKAAIGPQLD